VCIDAARVCVCVCVCVDQSSTAAAVDCRRNRPTCRASQPTALQYGECQSVDKFRLKYCRRNRCCSPRRSTTIPNVQFRCPDNKLISERFMQIRRCECRETANCPYTVDYDDDYDDDAADD